MKKQLIEPLIVGICCRISGKQVRVIVTAKSLSVEENVKSSFSTIRCKLGLWPVFLKEWSDMCMQAMVLSLTEISAFIS